MKIRGIYWTCGVLIASIILILFYQPIFVQLALWLDVGESPRAADYVMVLPGGPERRPFVASAMIKKGLAKCALTAATETDPANDEGVYPKSEKVLQRILTLRGIPESQIRILPGSSKSTWTDAMALAEFMRENPNATIAIITDDFHTRRSSWTFRRVLGSEAKRIFFVSARLDRVSPHNWWTTEEGFGIYVSEYFKLLAYVTTDRTYAASTVIVLAIVLLGFRFTKRRSQVQMIANTLGESVQPR